MRLALAASVLLLALTPAAAARAAAPQQAGDLWATVNFCDTAKHPDAIGIRASMPGLPKGVRLQMRFRVQFRDGDVWRDVADADSGWRMLGIAKGTPVETGWSFMFAQPTTPVTLRGVVRYRWRRGDALPRQSELITAAGHQSSAGGDPADYSAATCTLGS
jgi:hypothetical protein